MSHTSVFQGTVMTEVRQITTPNVPSMNTYRRADRLKLSSDDPFVTPAVRRYAPSRRGVQYDRQTDRRLTVVTRPETSHRVK